MKNKYLILLTGVLLMFLYSCSDAFDDMNVDPDSPTETQPNFIFTNLIRSIGFSGSQNLYLYCPQTMPIVRMVGGGSSEDLENTSGIDASWSEFFGKLKDINGLYEMIEKSAADPKRHVNQKAMLTIYKVYHAFRTLDKFGDMPYKDAGKGYTDLIFRSKYDTQQEVYYDLLDELKEAVSSIVLEKETTDGESIFDFVINARLWGGSDAVTHFEKWKKFGTSLILKYALRMSKADEAKAKEYISFALNNGLLMGDISDGAALYPTSIDGYNNGSRKNAWSWAFYYSPGTRPAQFLATKLTTAADPGHVDSTDVFDPRFFAIYYPNDQGQYMIIPNSPDDIRDLDMVISDAKNYPGGEWARTLKPWSDPAYEANYCVFNRFYMLSLFMPQEMLTYSEHCLVLAEIYAMNLASGDAQIEYEKGVRAAIKEFTDGANGHYPDDNPSWIINVDDSQIDDILANSPIKYDPGNALELIRTQRYINYIRRPDNAWSVVRRTNLFDLDNTVPLFRDGQKIEMIWRVKYPANEIDYNTDNYLEALGRMGGQDDVRYKNWLWQ